MLLSASQSGPYFPYWGQKGKEISDSDNHAKASFVQFSPLHSPYQQIFFLYSDSPVPWESKKVQHICLKWLEHVAIWPWMHWAGFYMETICERKVRFSWQRPKETKSNKLPWNQHSLGSQMHFSASRSDKQLTYGPQEREKVTKVHSDTPEIGSFLA